MNRKTWNPIHFTSDPDNCELHNQILIKLENKWARNINIKYTGIHNQLKILKIND